MLITFTVDLAKYKEDNNKGFIAEVDLQYPEELHDLHNDYPLGPENVKVTKNVLSEYCTKISDNISTGLVYKLITTLGNKKKLCFTLQKLTIIYGSWP